MKRNKRNKKEVFSKKKHQIKRPFREVDGEARMTRDGFVFVRVEGEDEDFYVKPGRTRGALHGDKVRMVITKTGGPHSEGEIVKIIERSPKPFVGILHVVGRQAWVLMSSRTMPYDISVPVPEGGKSGMKVAAVVDEWPRGEAGPLGHVIDVLGQPGENDTEMHAILAEYGLPYRFTSAVENAADKIPDTITDKERSGRRDFRKVLTFTIDPADAKDYDDAISFRRLESGNFEVGVHIADVTWYVRPGTPVDKEAEERGTSVYLVDRTVPMLPEKLSNKLCSLRPGEEKLTFSAVFEITPQGKVFNPWFGRTNIISDYRFSYELAQEIIEAGPKAMEESFGEGSECGIVPAEVKDAVLTLNDLALKLRKKRFAAGAISFDRPEMKVDVDENGKPIGVHEKISKEANWLIEEFMLLANKNVAEFVASGGKFGGKAVKNAKTFVYRVHDEPNLEKISSLRGFAGNFGYTMGATSDGSSTAKSLNALFNAAKGKPEFGAIEMIALRAMAKACYSTDNIGHYGLAFKFYTHFTSPIRRYPDMMVHRLLSMYLDGADSQSKDYYEKECQHASEREVIAAEAERESIKYKIVEFMEDKIGQEFDGTISGLTEWGMYVEIEPTKIEGMVALREIRSDFYDFDEEGYRIVGRRTGRVFQLGDKVHIRVKATNLDQKILDYELIEEEGDFSAPVEMTKRERSEMTKRERSEMTKRESGKGKREKRTGVTKGKGALKTAIAKAKGRK